TAGNTIAPETQSKYSQALTDGYLLWEFYPNISGTAVDDLRADVNFPDNPARRAFLTSFSTIPQFGADLDSNFGARISGWITPSAPGNYFFFLRSDDSSELWLSEDGNPA